MRDQKAIRRHNLSLLRKSYGTEALAKDTGIDSAYLYQMSDAIGKQARGVSDQRARVIEAGASLDDGWLDIDRREHGANVVDVDVKAAKLKKSASWPFRTVERERFEKLDEGDRLKVEGAMIKTIAALEKAAPTHRTYKLPRK